MILEFKTKVNTNGNSKHLRIDTDSKEYTRQDYRFTYPDAITVTTTDYRRIVKQLQADHEYTETLYINH